MGKADNEDTEFKPFQKADPDDPETQRITRGITSTVRRLNSVNPETAKAFAEIEKIKLAHDFKVQEDKWFKTYWRPAMGWLYMVICAFDFLIAPVIMMTLPARSAEGYEKYQAWKPLTLDGGGMIHFAFGAVLGITSWTKGQERVSTMKV